MLIPYNWPKVRTFKGDPIGPRTKGLNPDPDPSPVPPVLIPDTFSDAKESSAMAEVYVEKSRESLKRGEQS